MQLHSLVTEKNLKFFSDRVLTVSITTDQLQRNVL